MEKRNEYIEDLSDRVLAELNHKFSSGVFEFVKEESYVQLGTSLNMFFIRFKLKDNPFIIEDCWFTFKEEYFKSLTEFFSKNFTEEISSFDTNNIGSTLMIYLKPETNEQNQQ